MNLSIELPSPLDQDLARDAEREGISASEQATLLLLLASAFTGEGRNTRFRMLVREFLRKNSLDADHLSRVCEGLIALCLDEEDNSSPNRPTGEKSRVIRLDWRSPEVHRTMGDDEDFDIARVELPPLETLIQKMGRIKRDPILGKYAHLKGGTEEFMREKQLDIDREDRTR